jgi:hypothetical protein
LGGGGDGQLIRTRTSERMEVRAAHAGNEDPEHDLSRAWLGERKLTHLVISVHGRTDSEPYRTQGAAHSGE